MSKWMRFLRRVIILCLISVSGTGVVWSGMVRDIAVLRPQTSNQLSISLSLVNVRRRNTLRPGRPVSLQVTFHNAGLQRMHVLYSRVYRAGNLVIVDAAGNRISPHIYNISKYHLLEDDWHLIMPAQSMQLSLEGSLEINNERLENERKFIFDEIEFVLPGPGEYTLYFVLRQDEPSHFSFMPRDEWTGCAISNAVKIRLR